MQEGWHSPEVLAADRRKAAEVVVVVVVVDTHNPLGPGESVGIPRSPGQVVGNIQHIVAEAAGRHILQCYNSCQDIQTSYNT